MFRRLASLKGKLIAVFIGLIIFFSVTLVATPIINWNKSIDSVLLQLNYNSSSETVIRIDEFLRIPIDMNDSASILMQTGVVDMGNVEKREKYFLGIMDIYKDKVYSFSFGSSSGEYYGVRVNEQDKLEIMRSNESTGGRSIYFEVKENMTAGEIVKVLDFFDPRTRKWYTKASDEKSAIFSPIYKHFVMHDLALSAAIPVYDDNKNLIGVFGTHFPLGIINEFLVQIGGNYNNVTYIIDLETEEVIANSLGENNFTEDSNNVMYGINIKNVDNEVSRKAYSEFIKKNLTNFVVNSSGMNYLVTINKYNNFGLDWVIITYVAEASYKQTLLSSTITVIIICFAFIIAGIILWIFITGKLLRPIDRLMEATKKFSNGDLNYRAENISNDEIGRLTDEFNNMADNIQETMNKYEKASRIKSLFLANMSHEIRTPMNGVIGFVQLLKLTDLNDEQKEYIEYMKISANNLNALINDILDISKIEAEKIVMKSIPFDIVETLKTCILNYSVLNLNNNVDLKFHFEKDIPKILIGDPLRVSQIVNNLISNAVKFTEEGYILLTVQKKRITNNNEIEIIIIVEDTGVGIKENDLENIFEAFTQSNISLTDINVGSGLGLSICKKIVELMGGEITVQSEYGVGSKFTVSIKLGIHEDD